MVLPLQGERSVGEPQRRVVELCAVGEKFHAIHKARERLGGDKSRAPATLTPQPQQATAAGSSAMSPAPAAAAAASAVAAPTVTTTVRAWPAGASGESRGWDASPARRAGAMPGVQRGERRGGRWPSKKEPASSFCPFAPVESFLVAKVSIGWLLRGHRSGSHVTTACPSCRVRTRPASPSRVVDRATKLP